MCLLNGRCFMFHSKKLAPAVFTWQTQGSLVARDDAALQAKRRLPGRWWPGHSLCPVRAPQAIHRLSLHTDNTTTTTKSEDGHYARTDYAGTVPVPRESRFAGTL